MKKEDFYELLGDVDEKSVKAAEESPVKRIRHKWIRYGGVVVAACLVVIAGLGVWFNYNKLPETSDNTDQDISNQDVALEYSNVDIYFLKNGEMLSVSEYLPCAPEDIFNTWKSYNRIGDEVKLISVKIEDNGTESKDSFVAYYTVGDTFTLNVTVTENLKDYYSTISEEKLLESLKLTLTSYQHIDFNEYNLILK